MSTAIKVIVGTWVYILCQGMFTLVFHKIALEVLLVLTKFVLFIRWLYLVVRVTGEDNSNISRGKRMGTLN